MLSILHPFTTSYNTTTPRVARRAAESANQSPVLCTSVHPSEPLADSVRTRFRGFTPPTASYGPSWPSGVQPPGPAMVSFLGSLQTGLPESFGGSSPVRGESAKNSHVLKRKIMLKQNQVSSDWLHIDHHRSQPRETWSWADPTEASF